MDKKAGIGFKNQLPWKLPADLKRFRELTMGHHIITGRRTFESIGKALPGRRTIVVTSDMRYSAEGCDIACSIDEAVGLARERFESELFICGGAEIYAHSIGIANQMYLTFIDADVPADTFFPEFDEREWTEIESFYHPADEQNQYPFIMKRLRKNEFIPRA